MTTGDPIATGIITNLARPGSNITGLTNIASDLAGKRLELLKEAFPKFTRLGVLWNPADPSSTGNLKETETVARALGIEVQSLQVRTSNDFESAFKAAMTQRVHAIIILQNALINARGPRIVELATKNRLPTMKRRTRLQRRQNQNLALAKNRFLRSSALRVNPAVVLG